MKTKAFARVTRALSAAAMLAVAISGPAAFAQPGQYGGAGTRAVAVDRNFIIGTWSNSGDCSTTVAFTADGGYATADGLEGQWSLSGDTLTLSGEAGATNLTVIAIDRNTMEVVGEDGSHDRSTRCAGNLGDVQVDDLRIA